MAQPTLTALAAQSSSQRLDWQRNGDYASPAQWIGRGGTSIKLEFEPAKTDSPRRQNW